MMQFFVVVAVVVVVFRKPITTSENMQIAVVLEFTIFRSNLITFNNNMNHTYHLVYHSTVLSKRGI